MLAHNPDLAYPRNSQHVAAVLMMSNAYPETRGTVYGATYHVNQEPERDIAAATETQGGESASRSVNHFS